MDKQAKQAAVKIIRDTFEKPFDKSQYIYFVKNLFNKIDKDTFEYHGQYIKDSYKPYIKKYERIGKYNDSEGNKIDILIVNLKKETSLERARTMQRNFVAQYLKDKGEKDAAVVAFHTDDLEDWRFSLVKMEYKLTQTKTGRIKAEEELTPARRYSFLVGENEPNHTAQQHLVPILQDDINNPTLAQFEEAFNIEKVAKEFFEKYRNLFIRTVDELDKVIKKDEKIRKDFGSKNINTIDFAKKLLGQIVFLYFLQKKGWFGVKRDDAWGTGPKNFMRELFEKKHGDYKNFFNDILEPLFYEVLARERDNNFYSRFNCKIPFLNGGLFESIGDYDWVYTDILLPNELFSNDCKTPEGDIGDGILNILDRYNFTVKEDEPLEKEVAIDPELLGKLYEKFNAIRPDNFKEYKEALLSGKKELEKKINKQYGVYYTPREIVHYMCQESLINYLLTELSASAVANETNKPPIKEDIETLIHFGDFVIEHDTAKEEGTKTYKHRLPESVRYNAKLIDEKLENIRICDPAIGSGAFPVGIMAEIVRARNALTTYLTDKKGRNIYNFKRHAIQNCIYGVDIDPSAVEIAKLRLWLSLVVDEEDIKRVRPLPNLDYKIMQGNSLLEEYEGVKLFDERIIEPIFDESEQVEQLKQKQLELQSKYFKLHSSGKLPKEKQLELELELKKINKSLNKIENKTKQENVQAEFSDFLNEAKKKADELKQLHKEFFDAFQKSKKDELKKTIEKLNWELIEVSLIEQNKRVELKKLEQFKKTNIRPYFLWKLNFEEVFQEKGGFDVVMANPPYVFTRKMEFSNEFKNYIQRNYLRKLKSLSSGRAQQSGKINLFPLFIMRGIFLSRESGLVTYIIPNTLLRTTTYDIYRKYIMDNTNILQIVDLGSGTFEGVTAATVVLILQKELAMVVRNKNKIKAIFELTNLERRNFKFNLIPQNAFHNNVSYVFNIFVDEIISELMEKISKDKRPLGFFCLDIIEGIVAHKHLITEHKVNNSYPLMEGKNIKKYFIATPRKNIIWDKSKIHRPRPDYLWESREKIVIQRISGGAFPLVAAIDRKQYRTFASVNNLLLKDDFKNYYQYILALFNSKLLNYYYANNFSNRSELTVNISKTFLEKLPIPEISNEEIEQFTSIVDKILDIAHGDDYTKDIAKQTKVEEYEHQIDQMVYKIYGLTEEEKRIIENSNKERR